MKNILLIYCIVLISSCSDSKNKASTDLILDPAIDTISSMNSLFDIEKVKLKANSLTIGNVIDYTIDKKGNIYILDGSFIIYKFDKNGIFLNKLESIGRGPGEYLMLRKFVVDNDQNLIVDDFLQSHIKIYNKSFKFKKYLQRKYAKALVDMVVSGNKLFCFDPFLDEHSIIIYDMVTTEILDEIGNIDKLAKKYHTRIKGGKIFIEDNSVYYSLPNYYQIFKIVNKESIKCVKNIPSYFSQVSKIIKDPMKESWDNTHVTNLFKEDNLFFLSIFDNSTILSGSQNQHQATDIISIDGEIVKDLVFFNDIK